jgi:ferredoxin
MPGETILDAAFRTGATWPTICYGQARCTACALLLRDGHENAGPPGPVEEGVLRQITGKRRRWPAGDTRLACQLTVTGEVTVEKKGAKPASGAGRGSPPETRADTESPATESLEEEETA